MTNFKNELQNKTKEIGNNIPVIYYALKDKDTPFFAKLIALITIIYALSPIDLVPDFIPVLGYLDDIIILPGLISLTIKLIPEEIWQRNKVISQERWNSQNSKRWFYAIPIAIIWFFIIKYFISLFWKK